MELSHLQQLKFRNAPSMESIRRVRADMQNTKGIYKAIPVVQKARKVEEAKVRGEMMGGHQEKLI